MNTKNRIEKYLENVKGGLIFGLSALLVMLAGGMIYATLSFPDLETVLPGDTLKASSWNEMVEAVNALKAESNTNLSTLNAINANLSTLSGQINAKADLASPTLTGIPKAPTATNGTNNTQIATTEFVQKAIQNIPSVPSTPAGVSCSGKYRQTKIDKKYNRSSTLCSSSFGTGRRLPIRNELSSLYVSSCKGNIGLLSDNYRTSEAGLQYSHRYFNMSNGNSGFNEYDSYPFYVICIYG